MEIIKSEGQFTGALWEAIEPVFTKIINHPFVIQLAQGTLSKQSFAHYLSQDILYLKYDNLALKILSEKAHTEKERLFFSKLSEDGLAVEFALQNNFLKYFNIKQAKERSGVIKNYTDFLIFHTKNSPYEVVSAALLPCFWVYGMVGKVISEKSVDDNIYQKWIDTYKDEEFEAFIIRFIKIVERLSANIGNDLKEEMKNAFVRATKFELAFFEESYCAINTK